MHTGYLPRIPSPLTRKSVVKEIISFENHPTRPIKIAFLGIYSNFWKIRLLNSQILISNVTGSNFLKRVVDEQNRKFYGNFSDLEITFWVNFFRSIISIFYWINRLKITQENFRLNISIRNFAYKLQSAQIDLYR